MIRVPIFRSTCRDVQQLILRCRCGCSGRLQAEKTPQKQWFWGSFGRVKTGLPEGSFGVKKRDFWRFSGIPEKGQKPSYQRQIFVKKWQNKMHSPGHKSKKGSKMAIFALFRENRQNGHFCPFLGKNGLFWGFRPAACQNTHTDTRTLFKGAIRSCIQFPS